MLEPGEAPAYRPIVKTVPALTAALLALAVPARAQDLGEVGEARTSTPSQLFVKGELVHPGTRELLSRFDHGGVRIGPHVLGRDLYLGVDPGFAYYPGDWALALHVPLNLLLVDTKTTEFGGLALRTRDWDELSDFTRIIRFISYGRRESPLWFSLGSLRPQTLGHGQLITHYQQNIDVDRFMTGLALDLTSSWGGAQVRLNDITLNNKLLGLLAFVKPFGGSEDPLLGSLSLGIEYAGDFEAPRCIQVSAEDRRCVPGSGSRAGADPRTGQALDDTFIRTDPELGRPLVEEVGVHAIGFSGEIRAFKSDRSDIKGIVTWHHFLGHGEGLAVGGFGRFTTGEDETHAFRVRLEYRTFSAEYAPSYFDTLYEVTKFQYSQPSARHQVTPTKYQAIFGDPENGFPLEDTSRRHGYRLEASWGMFGENRSDKLIAFGLGLEDSTAGSDTSFHAHLEVPVLRYLQVFGTFMRLNGDGLGDIFSGPIDNVVVLSGARLQVLPILFINAHYSRSFQIIRGPGRELHLGNANVTDQAGNPSPFFATDRVFENVQTLFVEVELGWEFKS